MPKPVKGENLAKNFQVRGTRKDIVEIREMVSDIKKMVPFLRKHGSKSLPYEVTSDVIRVSVKEYKQKLESKIRKIQKEEEN